MCGLPGKISRFIMCDGEYMMTIYSLADIVHTLVLLELLNKCHY